jgi:hypothetical protein
MLFTRDNRLYAFINYTVAVRLFVKFGMDVVIDDYNTLTHFTFLHSKIAT